MIRITNSMMVNNLKQNLNTNLIGMDKYQEQLSTGRKINSPSDNPAGLVKALRLRTNMTQNEQYLENISETIGFLETTDGALSNVNQILQRIREQTVNAANDTNDQDALEAIAIEVRQLNEQLKLVANTTYGTKYVFGGSNVTEAPCQGGAWVGNKTALEIEIGVGVKFPMNLNMKDFFVGINPDTEDISILNGDVITSLSANNLQPGKYRVVTDQVTGGIVSDAQLSAEIDHSLQNGVSNIFAGGSFGVIQNAGILTKNAAIQLTVSGINRGTGEVTYSYISNEYDATNGNYEQMTGTFTVPPGTAVPIGSMIVDIDMTAANISTLTLGDQASYNLTAAHGTSYDQLSVHQDYTSADGGSVFNFVFNTGAINSKIVDLKFTSFDDQGQSFESTVSMETGIISDADPAATFEKITNLFELIEELATNIESGQSDKVSGKLDAIDKKINSLLNQRAVVGARVNRLELQQSRLEDAQISYTSLLAKVEDADMAEVIMNLKMQENVYNAALAAGARIIQPTLVNYLS